MYEEVSKDGIIKVTRVHNFKDDTRVIFKMENGMTMQLDKKDDGNDLILESVDRNETILMAVTAINDSYGFGICTVGGKLLIEFINNIPNITLDNIVNITKFSNSDKDVKLLLNIVNSNTVTNNILVNLDITLPNLKALAKEEIVTNSIVHVEYIKVLQYLYNTYGDASDDGFTVTEIAEDMDKVTELKYLHEKLLSLGLNDEAESIKSKIEILEPNDVLTNIKAILDPNKEYMCEYGVRGDILELNASVLTNARIDKLYLNLYGDLYGKFRTLEDPECDKLNLDNETFDASEIQAIYEKKVVYKKLARNR